MPTTTATTTSPAPALPPGRRYFVSYMGETQYGGQIPGNSEVSLQLPVRSHKDVAVLADSIARASGLRQVVVLHYQPFEPADVPVPSVELGKELCELRDDLSRVWPDSDPAVVLETVRRVRDRLADLASVRRVIAGSVPVS